MLHGGRTAQDWGALVQAELSGRETFGTTARLIAQAMGRQPPDPGSVVTAAAHKEAAEASRREHHRVVEARAALNAERQKHDAALAAHLKEHEKKLDASYAEAEAARKAATEALARAQANEAAAAELKAKWQRKLAAFESAA